MGWDRNRRLTNQSTMKVIATALKKAEAEHNELHTQMMKEINKISDHVSGDSLKASDVLTNIAQQASYAKKSDVAEIGDELAAHKVAMCNKISSMTQESLGRHHQNQCSIMINQATVTSVVADLEAHKDSTTQAIKKNTAAINAATKPQIGHHLLLNPENHYASSGLLFSRGKPSVADLTARDSQPPSYSHAYMKVNHLDGGFVFHSDVQSNNAGGVNYDKDGRPVLHITPQMATVTALTIRVRSDINAKTNIKNIDNSKEIIDALRPVYWSWKSNPNSHSCGLIAQDVQNVASDAVHGEDGNYTLNYNYFIGLLVARIQELSKKVDILSTI